MAIPDLDRVQRKDNHFPASRFRMLGRVHEIMVWLLKCPEPASIRRNVVSRTTETPKAWSEALKPVCWTAIIGEIAEINQKEKCSKNASVSKHLLIPELILKGDSNRDSSSILRHPLSLTMYPLLHLIHLHVSHHGLIHFHAWWTNLLSRNGLRRWFCDNSFA